jgi:hypothetical protein
MDEGVQLTELELECRAHLRFTADASELRDDVRRVGEIALVVVGEVVDREIFETEGGNHLVVTDP